MMLGINKQGTINSIQEYMVMELKETGHLNGDDAEGIQSAYGGHANRTLANGIFIFMRVQPK